MKNKIKLHALVTITTIVFHWFMSSFMNMNFSIFDMSNFNIVGFTLSGIFLITIANLVVVDLCKGDNEVVSIKIFLDHCLSDTEVNIYDIVTIQLIKSNSTKETFLMSDIESQNLSDETYKLVTEAYEDYDNRYLGGRISKKLEYIEDAVKEYNIVKRKCLETN